MEIETENWGQPGIVLNAPWTFREGHTRVWSNDVWNRGLSLGNGYVCIYLGYGRDRVLAVVIQTPDQAGGVLEFLLRPGGSPWTW